MMALFKLEGTIADCPRDARIMPSRCTSEPERPSERLAAAGVPAE
jgi:hypothetical protein